MPPQKPKFVILGTGFGAFRLIKALKGDDYDVTVVSPRNYFLFTPLLASTTVGTLKFRSIIDPIRTVRRGLHYYQAVCTSIDTEKKEIHSEGVIDRKSVILPYDILVIAVGATPGTYGIPGVREHTFFLQDLPDARAIRGRIIDCFEEAAIPGLSEEVKRQLLHFVVVGGGPTGVEFAAEMYDFLEEDLKKWYPEEAGQFQITLLDAQKFILGSFDHQLSEYALKLFQRERIDVRTQTLVKEVKDKEVILADGTTIPCGLIVWSAGIGPTSLVKSLSWPKEKGHLVTDKYFRVKGRKDVYAIGDCATIEGYPLPATAQVAQQKGKYLGKLLYCLSKGKSLPEFHFKNMGMLAYVGHHRALADLPEIKARGFSTWLFWRSVYLTRLVSLKNKIQVIFDWWMALIFGRDISRF